jgi:hypothetical protein
MFSPSWPGRTKGKDVHGVSAFPQNLQHKLDPLLLEGWSIEHLVFRRLHLPEWRSSYRHIPIENLVKLQDLNEAGVPRAITVNIELRKNRMVRDRLPERYVGVEDNCFTIDLWESVGCDQVGVAPDILVGMVKVCDVDNWDLLHFATIHSFTASFLPINSRKRARAK